MSAVNSLLREAAYLIVDIAMNRNFLALLVVAVAVFAVAIVYGVGLLSSSHQYKPPIELTPREMPLFTLTNQYGDRFSLDSVRGKVVLLYFGYVNCPDVCPLVMSRFAYALDNLTPEELERVAFIFVTTDPERDTVEALRRYIKLYDERIIALTGSGEELKQVWSAYGFEPIYTEKDERGNYYVTHPAFVFVADKNLVIRYALTPELPPEEYLLTVRYMLSSN